MAIVFTSEPVAKNTTTKNLDLIKAAECKLQEKSVEYTQNAEFEVLPDEGYDGMSKVNVSVDVVVPTVQASKAITITQNGPIEILPDSDYDVMEKVEATINVPTSSTYDITQAVVNLYRFTGTSVPANVVGWENLVDGRFKCQRSNIKEFTMQLPKLEEGKYMFTECADLTSFTIPMPELTDGSNMFSRGTLPGYNSLKTLNLDAPKLVTTTNMFGDCIWLTDVTLNIPSYTDQEISINPIFSKCIGITNLTVNGELRAGLYLSASTNLTTDSLMSVINALVDLTGENSKTLTLGATNLAKLSDEQKAIATNKNWILA